MQHALKLTNRVAEPANTADLILTRDEPRRLDALASNKIRVVHSLIMHALTDKARRPPGMLTQGACKTGQPERYCRRS